MGHLRRADPDAQSRPPGAIGLRYTRFHTTALCSPTRAALLTGRNHHSVGTGVITEIGSAYPGYSGQIPKSAAMISEILRQNGYSTAFFGKNHNVPDWETSVSGPYDRWPALQGFDHFYGFIGGEANQWAPALYRDNQPVEMEVPKGKEGHYTLNDALADEAIKYIYQQKSVTPDRPFFVYYAPGATHAPHHVPKEWMDKFKGQFDQGWDNTARRPTAQLNVIPPDTKLTPRPSEIPAYDSLTPDQKRVAARLMEAFAAYTAQTDYEVGRVLDALEQIGQLHNTLVFWMIGDNGASMEGTLNGCSTRWPRSTAYRRSPAISSSTWTRSAGRSLQPLPGRLGVGHEHALPMGQAGRLASRRHAQPAGDRLAGPHQGPGRHPHAVPPRHRRRADHSGSGGHSASRQR